MKTTEINKRFYRFAYNFLMKNTPDEITEDIIKSYLTVPTPENNCKTLNDIFYRMLCSAQNRQMSVNVIGGAIGEVKNLKAVLDDFNVQYVLNKFTDNENQLLDEIEDKFNLKGKIRREEKSLWPSLGGIFCIFLNFYLNSQFLCHF